MISHYHKARHLIRRGIIGAAFVLFFCDLIAAVFPTFDHVWSRIAHLAVASAAFFAFLAEHWLKEELE